MRRGWNRFWMFGAIAAVIALIPTAALAATGVFTSTTTTPAVSGTNSSAAGGSPGVFGTNTGGGLNTRFGVLGTANGAAGAGVWGTGAKYGVFSNGPLGIASGKFLTCLAATGCVGSGALVSNAVTNPKLANGAVTSAKLAAGAVGASALQAGSVGATALATSALPTARVINGAVAPTLLSSAFQFLGPTASVTLTSGQALVGTVSAGLGSSTGAIANFSICADSGGGAFPLNGGILGIPIDAQRRIYSESVVLQPGTVSPGSYSVGLCATGNTATLNNNDWANGYVMTTLSN
jgi:hypothetical protein